jgi:hypothetical protein
MIRSAETRLARLEAQRCPVSPAAKAFEALGIDPERLNAAEREALRQAIKAELTRRGADERGETGEAESGTHERMLAELGVL